MQPHAIREGVRREVNPAVFKDGFYVVFVSPPPGGPGEGPDCHFPKEIVGFGCLNGPPPPGGPEGGSGLSFS